MLASFKNTQLSEGENNDLQQNSAVLILKSLSDNDASFTQNKQSMMQSTKASKLEIENPDSSLDHKLVLRVRNGDKKAFDLLVVKYQGRVASVVSRYVKDSHEVFDVTQEAFIKAYRAINSFRGESAFYTWLYRIAINCAKNYLQSRGRRPPSSDVDVSDAEHLVSAYHLKDIATPETIHYSNQLEQVIKRTIDQLPEDLRTALTLREFENLSYEDIAVVMACPVGTVRSRIFRARETIEKEINAMRDS